MDFARICGSWEHSSEADAILCLKTKNGGSHGCRKHELGAFFSRLFSKVENQEKRRNGEENALVCCLSVRVAMLQRVVVGSARRKSRRFSAPGGAG